MQTLLHRLFGLTRLRGFDSAGGGTASSAAGDNRPLGAMNELLAQKLNQT